MPAASASKSERRFWSHEETRQLCELRAQGLSFIEIASKLGDRTEDGCRERHRRILGTINAQEDEDENTAGTAENATQKMRNLGSDRNDPATHSGPSSSTIQVGRAQQHVYRTTQSDKRPAKKTARRKSIAYTIEHLTCGGTRYLEGRGTRLLMWPHRERYVVRYHSEEIDLEMDFSNVQSGIVDHTGLMLILECSATGNLEHMQVAFSTSTPAVLEALIDDMKPNLTNPDFKFYSVTPAQFQRVFEEGVSVKNALQFPQRDRQPQSVPEPNPKAHHALRRSSLTPKSGPMLIERPTARSRDLSISTAQTRSTKSPLNSIGVIDISREAEESTMNTFEDEKRRLDFKMKQMREHLELKQRRLEIKKMELEMKALDKEIEDLGED